MSKEIMWSRCQCKFILIFKCLLNILSLSCLPQATEYNRYFLYIIPETENCSDATKEKAHGLQAKHFV